jgi:hypothetical protein
MWSGREGENCIRQGGEGGKGRRRGGGGYKKNRARFKRVTGPQKKQRERIRWSGGCRVG